MKKKDGNDGPSRTKPKAEGGSLGFLPPPPGGTRLPAPPGSSPAISPAHAAKTPTGGNDWGDFASAQTK